MKAFALMVLIALPSTADAESVTVKYAGEFDISAYDCEPTKPSSFVNRICYNEDEGHLIVLLRNTYYQYCKMPGGVVADWRAAPSLGKFYNQNVKANTYGCN